MIVTPQAVRFMGRRFPVALGRGGIVPAAAKREGDGATPAGILHVAGMFYRPDRIAAASLPLWAEPIGPADLWSDDPRDPDYNHHVRTPHRWSHERLRRADPLYDLVIVTDWNWPEARAGHGSAIFVHSWRRPRFPTAGCIAFRPDHLLWIAGRVRQGTRIVVRG